MIRLAIKFIFSLILLAISSFYAFGQTTVNFNTYTENQGLSNPHVEGELEFEVIKGVPATCIVCIGIDFNDGKDGSPGLDDSNFEIGGIEGWKISREDDASFQLLSFWIQERGDGSSVSGTITAYKGGSPIGAAVAIDFNSASTGLKSLSSNPDFYDVDEVRIEGVDLYLILDEITFSDPNDDTAPTQVIGINLDGSPLSTATSVQYKVEFSKIANNVTSDDFELVSTGTASGTIGSVTGSNASYTVTITGISGEGTIQLNLLPGTDIASDTEVTGTSAFTTGQIHAVSACLVEDFEDETDGSKTFTHGGNDFSITGDLEVHTELPSIGIHGSNYVLINTDAGAGSYTITSNSGEIKLKKFAVFLSSEADGANPTDDGSITVVGKNTGNTEFTINLPAGEFPTDFSSNSGYYIFDFATAGGSDNSNTPIDELIITLDAPFQYINIDNFEFCEYTAPIPLSLSGTFEANDKPYDATNSATLASNLLTLNGVLPEASDVTIGSIELRFIDEDAEDNKLVSIEEVILTGADAGLYSVDLAGAPTTTATITNLPIAVTGVSADDKPYDGTNLAVLSGTPSVAGLGTDDVSVGGIPEAEFIQIEVGDNIDVIVSGYVLSGADASNYSIVQPIGLQANITPATITGITFDDDSFEYDGTAKSLAITGTLPAGTQVNYTNNSRTDVGTQEVTATITGSNYTTLELKADLEITPAPITGITLEDQSFFYDGTPKSLEITGTLPAGAAVDYTNNSRIDVGTQEVTATISGSNYFTLILKANLTINLEITGITFNDGSFEYDGSAKSLAIEGTLPTGTSVDYTNNSRTDVGIQEVIATISGVNYETLVLFADLEVTPATITGITLADQSFIFDGTVKSLAIEGTLPTGTSVDYTNNGRIDVGIQEVTATISGSNYTTLELKADLEITLALIVGISFEDKDFEYDGTAKSLAIEGALPIGTSVSYTNNSRIDVGAQEVTATISGANYQTLILYAKLKIKKVIKEKKEKKDKDKKVTETSSKEGSNAEGLNSEQEGLTKKANDLNHELRFGEFSLFPNPADSEVTIKVELGQTENVGIKIFDSIGRLVYEEEGIQSGNSKYQINIYDLSPGLYMVQVKTGQLVMMKRLIKK